MAFGSHWLPSLTSCTSQVGRPLLVADGGFHLELERTLMCECVGSTLLRANSEVDCLALPPIALISAEAAVKILPSGWQARNLHNRQAKHSKCSNLLALEN